MTPQKQLGLAIYTIRKAKKISQEDLANKAGIDRSHMSSIELGKADVRLSTIVKLSEGLDVTVAHILSCVDSPM